MYEVQDRKAQGTPVGPCHGYANISVSADQIIELRRVKKIISLSDGPKYVEEFHKLPRYQMKDVSAVRPRFVCPDFDEDLFRECLASRDGKRVVDALRHKHANDLIERHILDCRREVRPRLLKLVKGHPSALVSFITNVLKTPPVHLDPEDKISNRDLSLTKEEIWNEFKKRGVLNKLLTLKKESHGHAIRRSSPKGQADNSQSNTEQWEKTNTAVEL